MFKIVKIVVLLFAVFGCLQTAEAAKVVNWVPDIYITGESGQHPLVTAERQALVTVIDDILVEAQKSNQLPFAIKNVSMDESKAEARNIDGPLGLAIVINRDQVISEKFSNIASGTYKNIVYCGMTVMICSVDRADGTNKVIFSTPLVGYTVIPPTNAALSSAEKSTLFGQLATKLLKENLVKRLKKVNSNQLEENAADIETYQVREVKFSSKNAKAIFNGQQTNAQTDKLFTEEFMKANVAEWFSHFLGDKKVVLPSLEGGNWKKDATSNIFKLEVNSPKQSLVFTMAENAAKFPINLDLTGLNSKIVKETNNNKVIHFKGWLQVEIPELSLTKKITCDSFKNVEKGDQEFDERSEYYNLLFALTKQATTDAVK